jgi:hypothetical protein
LALVLALTPWAYRSPSDLPQPRPGDVGYLSRLRRPDGNGTFVLLTGIHAVGSHGIIDFLRRELADLYEQVDLQPFSTLIATDYDPVTRQVVRSERITRSTRIRSHDAHAGHPGLTPLT